MEIGLVEAMLPVRDYEVGVERQRSVCQLPLLLLSRVVVLTD